MSKFSLKRLKIERNLRRIEKELNQKPEYRRCFFYASEKRDCYHHIIPRSQGLEWIAQKDNLLPIGRTAHNIIHFGTNGEIKFLPRFREYLEKMKKLNERYYNRYLIKLEK